MKIEQLAIPELLLITPNLFPDDRGYFLETFHAKRYEESGLSGVFVQDNISRSVKGTVRGLHYQIPPKAQGKLCQVICGAVYDVAVDIRFGSPTFGKAVGAILSEENHAQLWIPPGFAHGFEVLSDEAVFLYKCTDVYSKEHECAIRFNDPAIAVLWQTNEPKLSEKDRNAPLLAEITKDFIY